MTYTVEVRRIGHNHAEWMAEMRSWLEHHQIEPASFEHSSGSPGVVFRIGFSTEGHAADFAEAFRGRFDHGDDPHGAGLWRVAPED
jgi:hypothetical protein